MQYVVVRLLIACPDAAVLPLAVSVNNNISVLDRQQTSLLDIGERRWRSLCNPYFTLSDGVPREPADDTAPSVNVSRHLAAFAPTVTAFPVRCCL